MVNFVGAGCGAADLITVRGLRLIKEADVIIYAGSLVNPELLKDAKKDCAVYDSAKMTLEQVLAVMKQAEAEGKKTVRLHTGDPSLYGAIREQMDALSEAGISFEVHHCEKLRGNQSQVQSTLPLEISGAGQRLLYL